MQLVTQFVDPSDATEANFRLRAAGVMTKVTGVDPHILSPFKTGVLRVGLWVVFDDQFEDAVKLLENPDYVPQRKITVAEMQEIESSSQTYLLKSGKKLLQTAATIIFGACLLGLIVYIAIGVFNGA